MDANAASFTDLPPEIVDAICMQLMFDGHSLLRLGQTSRSWRAILRDPDLWARLYAARFGEDANPPPALPPAALPGWSFFPGMDSPGADTARPDDAGGDLSPASLAARAAQMGAYAFNTNGWIKSRLSPVARWTRFSYAPAAGLYVRSELVVRGLGLPPRPPVPEAAEEAIARPPALPGWLFYPLLDSPMWDIRHPATGEDHFMSSCSSLAELAAVAAAWPGCVAFNTAGCLKSSLEPQVHWRRMGGGSSWAGLYVREEVVRERGLKPPQQLQQGSLLDPQLRFFQRGHTRLLAARDVDVAWLNGTYLQRRPDPQPGPAAPLQAPPPAAPPPAAGQQGPALGGAGGVGEDSEDDRMPSNDDYEDMSDEDDAGLAEFGLGGLGLAQHGAAAAPPPWLLGAVAAAGMVAGAAAAAAGAAPQVVQQVVALRSVCWLELNGRFEGLGPGRYRVVWVLRVSPDCDVADGEELHLGVTLEEARTLGTAAAAGGGGGGGAAGASGAAATAAAPAAPQAPPPPAAAAAAPPPPGTQLASVDVDRAALMAHAGGGWYEQAGGEFELPGGGVYVVRSRLWNHSGSWKQGLMFREVSIVALPQ